VTTTVFLHLGLGDAIICNGLVRALVDEHGPLTTFCKPHNRPSVAFMWRDLPVTLVDADHPPAPRLGDNNIVAGFDRLDRSIPFDQAFYKAAGVPFEKRWSEFRWGRDWDNERWIGPYPDFAFVHDDANRGMKIDDKRLSKLPTVTPDHEAEPNIFRYVKLIEQAAEVHVIPSAFMFLVDSMPRVPGQHLVLHRYTRKYAPCDAPTLRHDWEVLE